MLSLFVRILLLFVGATVLPVRSAPMIGIDSNYALDMKEHNRTWTLGPRQIDPIDFLAKTGCTDFRVRLWVGDKGMNHLAYAIETARRAQQDGLKPYLVLFLSDDWSDLAKQPVPEVWKHLSLEKKAAAIEAYAEHVTRKFAAAGVTIDLFEIGNEIDFGICGEFEEAWPHRVSIDFMRQQVWPRMVPIIRAAQNGVLKAQPKAKFTLHLSQWNNPDYCIAFWKAMRSADVRVDYPGISYFPTSVEKAEQRSFEYLRAQVEKISDAMDAPVLICETGYPSSSKFGGQFSAWKHPVEGYPLSETGQAKWIRDLLVLIRKDSNFAGAFYWSPEWYGGGLWDAFALFDSKGRARLGVRAFKAP